MEYKTKKHRRTYAVWYGMIRRCTNTSYPHYADYGGRGITVCDRWMTYSLWLEDIGFIPDGMSIERKDNNLGYFPENVILADWKTQCNNRRSNHLLTYNGETKNITEWAKERNIKAKTLWQRIVTYGWAVEKALERVG